MRMQYHILALLLAFLQGALGYNTTISPSYLSTSSGYYYVSNSSSNVSCSNASTALPSLTYVVDTSGSMNLPQIQEITGVLYNRLLPRSATEGRQYTLMEFNDPSVGPLRATCSISDFYNYVYSLNHYGGGDCPEYAMAGLLKALEGSPVGSVVVLATDASAKDATDTSTVNKIFSLIDLKKVKVFILGPSPCNTIYDYDYQVYRDIAFRSYGHIFQNVYTNSKFADFLYYFLQIPVNSTTQLLSVNGSYYYSVSFDVPTNLSALIISAACQSCSSTLYKPSGAEVNGSYLISEDWGLLSYVTNPKTGSWQITISAVESWSLNILGFKDNNSSSNMSSSICSSCSPYASCEKTLFSYTCVCNDGFSGDGYNCYDVNECDYYPCGNGYCVNTLGAYYCVCYYGFTTDNDNKTCVDIDECSSPSLNTCHTLATCVNAYGSYSCYCPYGYYGTGTYCELDECKRDVCGFGRECIKSYGSHSCVDPCYSYTTLNEPTRSTDYYYYYYYYYGYGRSDSGLSGWYRFTGSGGIRMPEFCPAEGHCYTRAPMWLNGAHPDVSDGLVNRTVCVPYSGICCYWTTNILVRSCPGGFHVYKFSGTPYYYSGYCTDPTTTADSCRCTIDEECKLVNGHYGCYCKQTSDISALESLRPELSCGNLEVKASFKKCYLQRFNLNTNNVHLRDKSCVGFPDYINTNTISVLSLLKNGVCGNELVNNRTHVFYKNTLFLSLNMNASLGGEDVFRIDYSCIYPLDMVLSLQTALKPFASSANVTIENTGSFLITMALYQDSGFKSVYEGSEALVSSETNLYIGIILKSGDTSQFTVQMRNCFATPTNNQSSSAKYYIIKDSCPSKQDSTINVIENGQSQNGRFSVKLFGYIKNSNVAYLHCEIHLCDKTSETCNPSCTGARELVSQSSGPDAYLKLGPIIREDNPAPVPAANGAPSMMTSYLTVAIPLVILSMLLAL